MKKTFVLTLALLLAITAGAQTNKGGSKSRPAATAGVAAVRNAWIAAYNGKQADKVADLYTDDAILATSAGTAQGKEAIRAYMQKAIDMGDSVASITPTHTEVQGSVAFESGTFQDKVGDHEMPGHYLVVLKKVGGTWKIAAHNSVLASQMQPH